MKKWILLIVIAAAAGGWWFLKLGDNAEPEYQTVAVARGEMTQLVTATGTLNPVINVQVGSQVSGNISKLYADFNSPVTAGQVVAELDPSIYRAIVHQAEGDLANAKAALELAQTTAARKKELVAQHAAPQADLDAAMATLHQGEANVQIKEANLEKAKVDLGHCTILSPIDGTVISRSVDVGQTIAASFNAPVIFTIANDLTKMQIDSNVAEADVGSVVVDQDVDFTVDAYPYRTFHGKVAQVRNAATTVQNVVTYDVVIAVSNPDLQLKPGMTANVSVIVAHREDALKIPNGALRFRPPEEVTAGTPAASPSAGPRHSGKKFRGDNGKAERAVYVLPPGGAMPGKVMVKVGINDGIFTEVLEGLKEGDPVVIGSNTPAAGPSRPPQNPLSGAPRRF